MTTVSRALYSALRLIATWLQQPTVIEVADGVDVTPHSK